MTIEISVHETGRKAPKWDLDSDLNGDVSMSDFLRFTKNSLIQISQYALKEEQLKGFDKKPVTIIDNRYGRTVDDVSPLGKIEFIARQESQMFLAEIYKAILERSPVLTGRYMHSNLVTYNGEVVASNMISFQAWLKTKKSFSQSDKIRFINTAPYANKLELEGTTSSGTSTKRKTINEKRNKGRNGLIVRKPNGAYTLAYRSIKNRFKGISLIKYEQILGSDAGLLSPARGSGVGRIRQKKGPSKGRTYVYPSILVYIQESGIKQ